MTSPSQALSILDTSRYSRTRIPTAKCQPIFSLPILIVKRSIKGRRPKAAILVPTASALAIIEGEDVKETLEEAVTIVEPVEIVNKVQIQKPEEGGGT